METTYKCGDTHNTRFNGGEKLFPGEIQGHIQGGETQRIKKRRKFRGQVLHNRELGEKNNGGGGGTREGS